MPKNKNNFEVDEVVGQIKKFQKEAAKYLGMAKERYDELDDKTKQKIVKGVGAAAAALAALGVAHKIKKAVRKNEIKIS